MKAYLTYTLNQEGKLVHVEDVPNGNDCRCICPFSTPRECFYEKLL